MRFLLDTNIVIAAMKGFAPVRARLERTLLTDLVLSPVVLGELEFGAQKSAHVERNRARIAELVAQIPVLPVDVETGRHYGEVRAMLERLGTPIGSNDTWIAAHALALDAVLVTDNMREFSRIPALSLENWAQPAGESGQ